MAFSNSVICLSLKENKLIDFSINGIYGDALLFWVFTGKATSINDGG